MKVCDLCFRDEDKTEPVEAVAEVEIRMSIDVLDDGNVPKAVWAALEKSTAQGTLTWDVCLKHLKALKDENAAGDLLKAV
jgi:hypothetical protein